MPFRKFIDILKSDVNRFEINWMSVMNIFLIRICLAVTGMERTYHPDENMQGTEIAYKMVFGDKVDVMTTWEWIDIYSLRNIIYPAYLSIPFHILKTLNLDYNILIRLSPFFMNSIIQVIGDVYSFIITE